MLRGDEPDEVLMTLYQQGGAEAFSVLYARHSAKIYGYLKSRMKSEQEVSDLFQETFVKIHKAKHLYNKSLPVLPWLFSITHSVLIDGLRKAGRRKETYGFESDQIEDAPTGNESSWAALAPLLQHLPGPQQAALQMRYVDEKTFDEIATALKTSPPNVRQMVSRGIKSLKKLINKGDQS